MDGAVNTCWRTQPVEACRTFHGSQTDGRVNRVIDNRGRTAARLAMYVLIVICNVARHGVARDRL
jgi:hypothetical protein